MGKENKKKFNPEYFKKHSDPEVRALWGAFENMTIGIDAEFYLGIRTTCQSWNELAAKGDIKLADDETANLQNFFKMIPTYRTIIKELQDSMMPEELEEVNKVINARKTVEELT